MSILENIHGHDDLTRLDDAQRKALCAEIREFLVDSVAKTGGHLAANLGAVELTVAIETVFDTSVDRLVFDVGHQSYVHKLLTGRQADFAHLRQFGGMAGFPKPEESPADAFVAGHASNSVSIALGMARARTLMGEGYSVVALLGDGAATGGMIYEALNDVAVSREPMVIILNDNAMSISRNVGGISRHLSRLRTKEQYLGMKRKYRGFLAKIPGGAQLYRLSKRAKDRLKRILLPTTIFDNMGLNYLGPVDGHDLPGLISLLASAREMKRPVVVHVATKKGHGYLPAEQDPAKFHGIGKFDPVTGQPYCTPAPSFSDMFGKTMVELAAEDSRVCAITAAMLGGTGLLEFRKKFPRRTFDVGIAEEHGVSMAGGLAKQGMIPVVAIYSTFLQRAFDQILEDVGLLTLHVVFAVDRAGLVGEDGATHHGAFDVGFLRQVPGMTILAPASLAEQREMLKWAVERCSGPVAVRYPRGGDRGYAASRWQDGAGESGLAVCHRQGGDLTLITYGTLLENTLAAADILSQRGIEATVLRLLTLSPLPIDQIRRQAAADRPILVAEEACANSTVWQALAAALPEYRVFGRNLGADFVAHGNLDALYRHCHLDGGGIADYAQEVLGA